MTVGASGSPQESASAPLAVIVPMLNESDGAQLCVERITAVLASSVPGGMLIVVDDGSSDGTGALLDDLRRTHATLEVIHHDRNLGYGAALRSGAERAQKLGATWVLFMDSDLTNPPEDIVRFVDAMNSSVDYVKATRYGEGGSVRDVPLKRRLISQIGNLFAGVLFCLPLSDFTNGFRAIRVSYFVQMPLQERGFSIIMEEAYWAEKLGLRSSEIPTTLSNRSDQIRGSSFHYKPAVIYSYARYPTAAFTERLVAATNRLVTGTNRRARLHKGDAE